MFPAEEASRSDPREQEQLRYPSPLSEARARSRLRRSDRHGNYRYAQDIMSYFGAKPSDTEGTSHEIEGERSRRSGSEAKSDERKNSEVQDHDEHERDDREQEDAPQDNQQENPNSEAEGRRSNADEPHALPHESDVVLRFGDRLPDDLMNTFCDKLQKVADHRIDGFLAIQFPLIDEEVTRKMISGKHKAIQIIYITEKAHYCVLFYDPRRHEVIVYDSMCDPTIKCEKHMTASFLHQIYGLFGHLYHGQPVQVSFAENYEQQYDCWSCGYRSIACVVNLALNKTPTLKSYDIGEVFNFFKYVNESTVKWEDFKDAELARPAAISSGTAEFEVYPNLRYYIRPVEDITTCESLPSITGATTATSAASSLSNFTIQSDTVTERTDEGSTSSFSEPDRRNFF